MIKGNFENLEDGLYYCSGDHHRSEPCHYVKLTEENIRHLLERSDNSDNPATPKLPSFDDISNALSLKEPTNEFYRDGVFDCYDVIKKLGNLA